MLEKTRTTKIHRAQLELANKDDIASLLQNTFLEIGAGPQPELARGLADAIWLSDRGDVAGTISVLWNWTKYGVIDVGPIAKLELTVSYTERLCCKL